MSDIRTQTAIRTGRAGTRPVVTRALILAAGVGRRLRPFTDDLPKCLVPVNGVPILVNALTLLAAAGITETVIVVGHLKEKVVERIGDSFNDMAISYVVSEDYATTNNIYSLWLARKYLDRDILLLEADVFFERNLIDRLLQHDGRSLAAVADCQPWMSGSVLAVDEDDAVLALRDTGWRDFPLDDAPLLKTINIYLFRGDFLQREFAPRLNAAIAAGQVNEYYETLLRSICRSGRPELTAVHCDDVKWIEIDDGNDLAAAEYLFSSRERRYKLVSEQFGEYWRYDFTDHALLYNLYYPPESMLDDIHGHLSDLILNYPDGQSAHARYVATLIDQAPEHVVVANGASELIKIIAGQLGKRLIVPVPSFNEWVNAAPAGQVVEYQLPAPDFQLDIDEFAAEAVRHEAGVAVVVSPNNPTSLAVPRDDLRRLAEKLASHDIILVVDESFVDFMAESGQATLEGEIGERSNLAIIKSMSKAYGIGGLRIGYLLTANRPLRTSVRDAVPIWNINGLASAFLRLAPRYQREFAASCRIVRTNCDDLCRGLGSIEGMTAYHPDANFVFCRLPEYSRDGPEVVRKLFVEHNILIKHCDGKTMPEAGRYLRIASRTPEENRALVEALHSTLRR